MEAGEDTSSSGRNGEDTSSSGRNVEHTSSSGRGRGRRREGIKRVVLKRGDSAGADAGPDEPRQEQTLLLSLRVALSPLQ